jgi:hypothetical protein
MKRSLSDDKVALELRTNLENAGIIRVDASFEEVIANAMLQRSFILNLYAGLPTTVPGSTYGIDFKISDFDMMANCKTDDMLDNYLQIKKIDMSEDEKVIFRVARTNLYAKVQRTKTNLIANMNFFGAPPKKRSVIKKPKDIENPADIRKKAAVLQAGVKENAAKRQKKEVEGGGEGEGEGGGEGEGDAEDDAEDEGDGEGDAEGETDGKKKPSKKFVERLVAFFPLLADGGYVFFGEDGSLECKQFDIQSDDEDDKDDSKAGAKADAMDAET